jgi:glycosyltransferase involved in cell wall biosynthesis
MSDIFLSVVLPCRDQKDHIEAVVKSYAGPLEAIGRSFEVVVVPNACRDRTPEIVRSIAAGDPRIRVAENLAGGWGLSVLTGLAVARGSVLCYTNSARTDPAQVPALLELYLANEPCLAKVTREQRSAPLREVGSWLFNAEGRLLFGTHVADVNGTPKMLPRAAYERLGLFSEGDLLDLELVVKARRLGLTIVELPVRGFRRHGGRSSTNFRSAWRMYAGALRLKKALSGFPERGARVVA